MTALKNSQSSVCPFLLLGLEPSAPSQNVETNYERLKKAFTEEKCMESPQAWVQAQQAYMSIEDAYKRITDGDFEDTKKKQVHPVDEPMTIKLGQLLVASGKISLKQLEAALAEQSVLNVPLGEILKGASLITQMELDTFLLNQRLIKLPADEPHQIGQRLIGLGLVTEDMVRIALVEQRTGGKALGEILVERGWLADEILAALTGN